MQSERRKRRVFVRKNKPIPSFRPRLSKFERLKVAKALENGNESILNYFVEKDTITLWKLRRYARKFD